MSVEISVVVIDSGDHPGPRPDTDVIFLPTAVDGDTPIYSGDVPRLLDALLATGVSATTWHVGTEAEFTSARGPITEALLQVAVGIASSAGWHAIQSLLLQHRGKANLIAVYERDRDRFRVELTGPAAEVAAELKRLDPFRPDSPRGDDPHDEPA
jgi:hypothetical protein